MFREILQSKLFTGAAFVIIGFFLVSIIRIEPPLVTVSKELRNLNQKINEAKKASLELEKLGDYLKSDAYFDRQARLKLNYKKPDEKVVFVYQKTVETNTAESPKNQELNKIFESKALINLKKWWSYLVSK